MIATSADEGVGDKLSVRQMSLPEELRGNIEFAEYEAGHMMYTNRPDMEKMHADIAAFIAKALK